MHTNSEGQSGYKMLKELNRNFTRFGRLGTKPIKVVGLVRRAFARVPERTVYQVRFCFHLQAYKRRACLIMSVCLQVFLKLDGLKYMPQFEDLNNTASLKITDQIVGLVRFL